MDVHSIILWCGIEQSISKALNVSRSRKRSILVKQETPAKVEQPVKNGVTRQERILFRQEDIISKYVSELQTLYRSFSKD